MGYILKKKYSTYDKNNPDNNVISTEKISFIQPSGLSQITNPDGDKLNLTSEVLRALNVDEYNQTQTRTFKVRYRGNEYSVSVEMKNEAYGLEDDNNVHVDTNQILSPIDSGVTRNQLVHLHMQSAGNVSIPILNIIVSGPVFQDREYILKQFTINFDMRDTYVDYSSKQTVETYWKWWARPVNDPLNNRRTFITEARWKPGSYVVNQQFARRVVGTYANCGVNSVTKSDNTAKTSTLTANLIVNVSNQTGEQGVIAGVYNWDVQFDSVNLVDRVA